MQATAHSTSVCSFPASPQSKGKPLTIQQAAAYLNLSPGYLRQLANQGKVKSYRLNGIAWRRFYRSDLDEFLGIENQESESKPYIICYARVSTNGQARQHKQGNKENDLGRQEQRLLDYAKEHYSDRELVTYSDIGSGLSYERNGFQRLMKKVLNGEYDGAVILLSYRERLVRYGRELCDIVFQQHNITVVEIEEEPDKSDEEDMASTILAICTSFAARQHSKRQADRKRVQIPDQALIDAVRLVRMGMTYRAVADELYKKGYRDQHNRMIRDGALFKHLKHYMKSLKTICDDQKTTIEQWAEQHLDKKPDPTSTVLYADIESAYLAWCHTQSIPPMTRKKISSTLMQHFESRKSNGRRTFFGVALKEKAA